MVQTRIDLQRVHYRRELQVMLNGLVEAAEEVSEELNIDGFSEKVD